MRFYFCVLVLQHTRGCAGHAGAQATGNNTTGNNKNSQAIVVIVVVVVVDSKLHRPQVIIRIRRR